MKLNITLDLEHEYGNDNENLADLIKDIIQDTINTEVREYLKNNPKFKASISKNAERIVEEFDRNPSIFLADIKSKISSATMKKVIFENREVQRQLTKVIIDKVRNCQI